MILLDTDHLTLLKYPENPKYAMLMARLKASSDQEFGTTIVSVEEQLKGWLAYIARNREVESHVVPYRKLLELLASLNRWTIFTFDQDSAWRFAALRRMGIRIGTMDLKIACIALVHDAVLLSSNRKDFCQVPGLRLENWLD